MLKTNRFYLYQRTIRSSFFRKQTFLTNTYSCSDAWNSRTSSPILSKINLNDFYNLLDQNYTSKGVISATDVDIFANVINDSTYLDELRDLIHKLRLSAETAATLESTHHATIRNYINYGDTEELLEILKHPLSYGIFLDSFTANILLDKLITSGKYEQAATVASQVMLQEDYSNEICNALCKYACYMYIQSYTPPPPIIKEPEVKKKKVEELKIRIKYLRNHYDDDHFDIKETIVLSGKTLAWMSEPLTNNVNHNIQIIGWLYYKKYDKLLDICKAAAVKNEFKIYGEIKELLQKECSREAVDAEVKAKIEQSLSLLDNVPNADTSLGDALKVGIENAINKTQKQDITAQIELFKSWEEIRQNKLNDQIKRLDRAKRIEIIQEKQNKLKEQEQKLWFFDNEDHIDLQIEEKEAMVEKPMVIKAATVATDDDYIPPEISPQRK